MRRSRTLAINALLATLIVIFTFIPIMPIGVSLAAFMLLPVLIAGQLESWRSALFAGTFLGVMSCIASFVIPSPIAGAFHNPLVSIVPRILVGMIGWGVYKGMSLATRKIKSKILAHTITSAVSAACAVIANTGLVLTMIWALYHGKTVGETAITAEFMMGLISINFTIEVATCTILTPPIAYAIKKSLNKSRANAVVVPVNNEDINLTAATGEIVDDNNVAVASGAIDELDSSILRDNAAEESTIINNEDINTIDSHSQKKAK